MDIPLDEVFFFDAIVSDPATGAAVDADSTPTYDVFEESTDTAILDDQNFTKRTSLTGNYRGSFTLSAANGFEVGKWYSVVASAVVGGVTGKAVVSSFRVAVAESVAGAVKVDLHAVSGDAPAADNLETMLDGTGGQTLTLAALTVSGAFAVSGGTTFTSATGNGFLCESTGGDGNGWRATGNGSGNGFYCQGGLTSGVGGLFRGVGGGLSVIGITNGDGLILMGAGTGAGAVITGGSTGHGVEIVGGSTSGDGINVSVTSGSEINADLVGTVSTVTTLTGHTPQTGDSFAIVSSGTFGNSAIKVLIDDLPTNSELTTVLGMLNDLDASEIRGAVGLAAADLDTQLAALPTAAEINAEVVDVVNVDTLVAGVTMAEALRRIGAITSGEVSDAGTGTETFEDYAGSAATIVIVVDASGNRTSVTYN